MSSQQPISSAESKEVSKVVKKSKSRAEEFIRDQTKAKGLLDRALSKAKTKELDKGSLAGLWPYLTALFRLFPAYIRRDYTDIPWGSIVLVTIALIYFVSPVDFLPDIIPVGGFVDDAAVVAFVINQIKSDLDKFLDWEARQGQSA